MIKGNSNISLPLFLFFTNLLWSFLAIIIAVIHIPYSVRYNADHRSLIIRVKQTGILDILPGYKNWRGITLGNILVLNPREEQGDEAHELIHAEQFMRYPGIFPLLYQIETYRNGYRNNKFELEAYEKAGNQFYSD